MPPKANLELVNGVKHILYNDSAKELKIQFNPGKDLVPEGKYLATIQAIRVCEPYPNKPTLEFTFLVVSGPKDGALLSGWVNFKYKTFSRHTKLYQWYSKITGEELDSPTEINLKDLYDKVLEVKVETRVSRKGKNEFSNVTEILRVVEEL